MMHTTYYADYHWSPVALDDNAGENYGTSAHEQFAFISHDENPCVAWISAMRRLRETAERCYGNGAWYWERRGLGTDEYPYVFIAAPYDAPGKAPHSITVM